MLPSLPTLYETDVGVVYSIISSDFHDSSWVRTYCSDLIIGQFRHAVFDATRHLLRVKARTIPIFFCLSSFGNHVRRIVGMGSQEKMVRIDAMPNVAFVQNKHSTRNWSIDRFPSNAMSEDKSVMELKSSVPARMDNSFIKNATSIGVDMAASGERCPDGFWGMFCGHDDLTESVDGSRVSPAVTGRRLQPLVPAFGL